MPEPIPEATHRRAGTSAQGRDLRARGRRTRERLLDAGAGVFATRGYHAARVDDVVKVAKTSHGTFYLYFSSKEDLFRALALDVAEMMVQLARELPDLGAGSGDTYGALHEWLVRFDELYAKYGPMIRTWTEAEIVNSEMGKVGGHLVAQFSRELESRLRDAAPDIDAGIAALAFVAMIERSYYYLESRQLRVDREQMVTTLARVMHAGLHGAAAVPAADPACPNPA